MQHCFKEYNYSYQDTSILHIEFWGRMTSTEVGRCLVGWSMGRGVPSPAD